MLLLLPDHDTKRDCVFKIGGRDPNASGARAPRHSEPLHPVPGDGGWFRRGPVGSFRLDERRPPLHSHGGGIATMRWPADAHLEVRRRLVNSLLERLRRRLRELGRPLREGLPSDGRRHSSNAPADEAPPRRTEIELSHPSRSADRTGSGEPTRLPAQQPPPPTSTRLKAAVFSKKRQPVPQRQSSSIWGSASILQVGAVEPDSAAHADQHPFPFGPQALPTEPGSPAHIQTWQAGQANLPCGFLAAIDSERQINAPHSVLMHPTGPDDTGPSLQGAAPLVGAQAFEPHFDRPTPTADTDLWAICAGAENLRSL